MEKVTGIGGIFFKVKDRDALIAWYRDNLGLPFEEWGGTVFQWRENDDPDTVGQTLLSTFPHDTEYFKRSTKDFMINLRVRDLDAMVAQLKAAGCDVDGAIEESEFGRFAWVLDPEGHRIELWQPPTS
ncbi:MAG: VOC family protein [Deltaproteobacteria bacterium]|nr:VOC family protein [Deltaproteobacteria bacterium]